MTFLHAWMLWLLPLAVLPIVLHLLTLHRLRTVELPTFRFLFDTYVQQRRRMQFLEALLAILRTLFLLFLVLLVTRPVVRHWDHLFGASAGPGGREAVLLVDASASMTARSGGKSAFERARAAALSVVGRLGEKDMVTLVKVGARAEEVLSNFNTDTEGIRARIDGLQPTSARANLFQALLQLFGPEGKRRSPPAIYLFTDCQANSWKEARDQGLEKLIPDGTTFTVVNVGAPSTLPNRAVVGDAPRRNRAVVRLPFLLTPRVVNYSKTEPAELTLSAFIDDKEVARTALTVEPGQTATRSFVYTPTEPGLRRGRFEITGQAPDRFPDDDRFLFTLDVRPRLRVVLVNGLKSDDPEKDEAAYLHTALSSRAEMAPAEKNPAGPQTTKEILASLDVQEVTEPGLTQDTLKDASVVVLANCGGLSDAQFALLRNFVREGGGLLIFPGDRVAPIRYNTALFPVPGPQGERLTAANLTAPMGDPNRAETFETFAALDLAHPALSVFESASPATRHFRTVQVYRRFGIELPPKRGNAWPLARFSSGAPALVESRLGDGTVLLAAFPAHPRWGNLPLKPDFVPLMLRLVSHAEHRPEAEVPPVVVADSTAEVSVTRAWGDVEATVKGPSGAPVPIALERSGARLLGAFEKTAQRGYYTVEARSNRPDQLKAATLAFAVNLAPEESDFTLLDEPAIRKLLPPGVKLTFVDASAEAQDLHGAVGNERELWPFLIWVVFAVIGLEFLLATVSGRKREGDGPTVTERVVSAGTGAWVGRMTGAEKETP
jgi:hypothetical protein